MRPDGEGKALRSLLGSALRGPEREHLLQLCVPLLSGSRPSAGQRRRSTK